MQPWLRCKDILGKRFSLAHDVESRGGTRLLKGTIVIVEGTWRGSYHVKADDGRYIRMVRRDAIGDPA